MKYLLLFLLSPLAMACDQGFEAFKSTVFVKVRKDCALCHDGSKQLLGAPPFAVADPLASYNQIVNYMSFSNLPESLLVFRAGNGHCGKDNCKPPSDAEMLQLVGQWYNGGESACERNGHLFSNEVSLPSQLPNEKTGFVTVTIPLDTVRPELKGISFSIEVQDFMPKQPGTNGEYRFRAPRFVGGQGAIYVKNLKILLNGKYDIIYDDYSVVDRTIPFFRVGNSTATPILSAQSLLILKDGLPTQNISISFVDVNVATSPSHCLNSAGFAAVSAQFKANKCATCHQSKGASTGERLLDMTVQDSVLCPVVTELVDPLFPTVSPLLMIPERGVSHPILSDDQRASFSTAVKAWLGR